MNIFVVDKEFTLNGIDLQMTLTIEQALMEKKHVVELCELSNFIHLTLTLVH